MNLMVLGDPRQSPRGQEKAQAIVTKSAHHFFFPYLLGTLAMAQRGIIHFTEQCVAPFRLWHHCENSNEDFLQKWFSSRGHPTFWREKGLCWWICPHEFSCALPMCPSPFSLACTCTYTHTHTHTHNSLELSPQEIRDIGFCFMCGAKQKQKLSAPTHKFCFIATRKHALSLSLSHAHSHTSTPRNVPTFQHMINRRIPTSGKLQLLFASSSQWELWQSCILEEPLERSAWSLTSVPKRENKWALMRVSWSPYHHIGLTCPRVSWHASLTFEK